MSMLILMSMQDYHNMRVTNYNHHQQLLSSRTAELRQSQGM